MDIVDRILEKIPKLIPIYQEVTDDLRDEKGNVITEFELPSKFFHLSFSLDTLMDSPEFDSNYLKVILDMIEDFIKDADEETQGIVEVMFLEGMWWWAEDKESEAAEKYGDYFFECLGPTCRRLCKENKEFWTKLNRERQDEIDKKYAALQRDYDERKKSQDD